MNDPLISVGIPFLNAKATLASAVRSVFAQTLDSWELILLDDGSTDGSAGFALSIEDRRVRVITDGQRLGLVHRLNQIAQLARGKYLGRLDADDLMRAQPDRLCRQLQALVADQSLDVVGTGAYTIPADGTVKGVRKLIPTEGSLGAVVARGLFIHPTVTGRTAWFREHPYEERFIRAEDHELWCRTFATSRFEVITAPLCFYREGGTCSLSKYVQSCRTDRIIYREYGPAVAGWPWTLRQMLTSHCKQTFYKVASFAGYEAEVISRRSDPLSEDARAAAHASVRRHLFNALARAGSSNEKPRENQLFSRCQQSEHLSDTPGSRLVDGFRRVAAITDEGRNQTSSVP